MRIQEHIKAASRQGVEELNCRLTRFGSTVAQKNSALPRKQSGAFKQSRYHPLWSLSAVTKTVEWLKYRWNLFVYFRWF